VAGHKQGVESLRRCVKACVARGRRVLTVFAFSSENWNRPVEEVSGLMDLMVGALGREVPKLSQDGVRLHFIGERGGLSDKMIAAWSRPRRRPRTTPGWCSTSASTMAAAGTSPAPRPSWRRGEPLTEASLDAAMALAHVPDPDLFIRTGGEQRLSNFLLWQSAYAELFFSDKLWPEFDEAALDDAIAAFQRRERRFGRPPSSSARRPRDQQAA
jgi:undecaprenyl diphosphate synthase